MSRGWISLHRKMMDNPIYSDSDLLKLWIHCLLKCTHADYQQMVGNTLVELEPGQFVTGRISLADEFNKGVTPKNKVSEITLWRKLKILEKMKMLNIKTTNKYSVVTVINWHEYQDSEQQMNNKRTSNEQQMNTNNNSNNSNNNNKKDSSRKRVYDEASDSYILAKFMCDRITKNNPDFKEPDLQKWSDDFRKILELDERNKSEVAKLVKWVQEDDFEMVNVLSPSKLRKRYDQLKMKMEKPQQEMAFGKPIPAPPKYNDLGGREY